MINITINGKLNTLPAQSTVTDLLTSLNAQGKRVAVERNGDIVPRSLHANTQLNNGDVLEIVIAVGGG